MRKREAKFLRMIVFGLVVACASVVLAHDRGKEDHGKPKGGWGSFDDHGWPGGGCSLLKASVDPVCKQQCESAERSCKTQAREALRSCLNSTCADAIAAARTVCATSPWSQECSDAWRAYVQCAQPCTATFRSAEADCRAAERACKAACPILPGNCPQPWDPVCRMNCDAEEKVCKATAQRTAANCLAACADAIATARQICVANPASLECQSALQAARSCTQPCMDDLRNALAACKVAENTCKASCISPVVNP